MLSQVSIGPPGCTLTTPAVSSQVCKAVQPICARCLRCARCTPWAQLYPGEELAVAYHYPLRVRIARRSGEVFMACWCWRLLQLRSAEFMGCEQHSSRWLPVSGSPAHRALIVNSTMKVWFRFALEDSHSGDRPTLDVIWFKCVSSCRLMGY